MLEKRRGRPSYPRRDKKSLQGKFGVRLEGDLQEGVFVKQFPWQKRLKAVRESLGMSPDAMANALDLSLHDWEDYETRENFPDKKIVDALARIGFSVRWVVTGEGSMMLSAEPAVSNPASIVLNKLRHLRGLKNDKSLGALFGVLQPTVSSWRARNSLPFWEIIGFCAQHNISLDYLFLNKMPCCPEALSQEPGSSPPGNQKPDPVSLTERIALLLNGMDEHQLWDVLKYTEKERLLGDLAKLVQQQNADNLRSTGEGQ